MNFFLYINRRLIIFFSLILILLFIGVILNKQLNFNNIEVTEDYGEQSSKADIYEPKFAINNNTKKIYVTAKEGNFLNKDDFFLGYLN